MIKQQGKDKKLKVGITHGDLNGISYEVIIKALNDNRILEMFTPVIYGLSKVLSYHRKNLNLNDFNYKIIRDASQTYSQKVNIVNLSNDEIRIEYGKSTPIAGKFAFQALDQAVKDIKDNKIDVLVTAPINKSNIQSHNFDFPGHTEFFTRQFDRKSSLMLMVNDKLRIGTVTGHIPLKDVASTITDKMIEEKINILNDSLIKDFGIPKPKIAVLALNPHAGEKGLIGDEDEHSIHPTIIKAKKHGYLVFGPFAADGFFGSDEYTKYDAILAMYHDQGLIPFKTLSFGKGVNYTAGLPIVRTSPAHGTAYTLAGKKAASARSMREALYLAIDICRNRQEYEEATKNPLRSGLLGELGNIKNNHANIPEELRNAQD